MCRLYNSNVLGMRRDLLLKSAVAMVFATLITISLGNPYLEEDQGLDDLDEYSDNHLEGLPQEAQEKRAPKYYTPTRRSSYIYLFRRSCIKWGASCEHRLQDCCKNSTCRCNLWGSNCRCQRLGLFQKWGK